MVSGSKVLFEDLTVTTGSKVVRSLCSNICFEHLRKAALWCEHSDVTHEKRRGLRVALWVRCYCVLAGDLTTELRCRVRRWGWRSSTILRIRSSAPVIRLESPESLAGLQHLAPFHLSAIASALLQVGLSTRSRLTFSIRPISVGYREPSDTLRPQSW